MKTVLTGLLLASSAAAQWMDVQTAYKPKDDIVTTRLEAGMNKQRWGSYGFLDIEGDHKGRFGRSAYLETRLSYNLFKGVGAAAEFNGGTEYEDTIRLGASFAPSLGKGNFTLLKAYPVDTRGKGPQLSVFSSQRIGKLIPSVLVDYNVKPGTTYAELELEHQLNKRFSLYAQMRGFGTPDRPRLQPLFGIKVRGSR